MSRAILVVMLLLVMQWHAMAAITPMFNSTGTPILERLLTGAKLDLADIDSDPRAAHQDKAANGKHRSYNRRAVAN